MQFLQPILLWGLLGISVPVLIHLWRGKKGQVISWAAMHWLSTKESSVAKGFRLENLLVLLLRCIMLVLLVLLLSKVFFPKLTKVSSEHIVHLVEPNKGIVDEYRFEIQQALEKGEEVYWADGDLTPIESIGDLESTANITNIQVSLDRVPADVSRLNLYLPNSQNSFGSEKYLSKIKPEIFLGDADFINPSGQIVSLAGVKTFQVSEAGFLDSISGNRNNAGTINLGKGDFEFFLGEVSPSEGAFIKASLEAINDVYGLGFHQTEDMEVAKLIFDSKIPSAIQPDKVYFISGEYSFSERSNMVYFSDSWDFGQSEMIQTGEFPEVILEEFLAFSGIEKLDVKLSQAQVEERFLVDEHRSQNKKANLNLLLLALFVLCFGVERYMANQRGI